MTYNFSAVGFPQTFSDMVAKASMLLPPLTAADDGDFVSAMAGKAINTFWAEYMGALPHAVQSELLIAIEKKDQDAVLDWYVRFANFPEDETARELATVILDELAEALPSLIKEEYAEFRALSPSAV